MVLGFTINSVRVINPGNQKATAYSGNSVNLVIVGNFNDTTFYRLKSSYIHSDIDSVTPEGDSLKFRAIVDNNAPMPIHFSIKDENQGVKDSLFLVPDINFISINKHIFKTLDTLTLTVSFSWNGIPVNNGIKSATLIIRKNTNMVDSIDMEKGDSVFSSVWQVPAIKGDFDIDLRVSTLNAEGVFRNVKGISTIPTRMSPTLFVFDAPNTPDLRERLRWYKDVFQKEFNDYFFWDVWYRGFPDSTLFSSDFIIWYESPKGDFLLSRRQKELFTKYLQSNGKCILIAPYLGRYIETNGSAFDSTFLSNVLHIKFIRGFNEKGYISHIEFLPENTGISHWLFTLYKNSKFLPIYGEEVDTIYPSRPLFSYEGGQFAGVFMNSPYSLAVLDFYPEEILSIKGEDIFPAIKSLLENAVNVNDISILSQNYPNPFSNYTIIPYTLKQDGAIKLIICDLAGRVVKNLDEGFRTKGEYTSDWDGRDERGKEAKAGFYFYHLIIKSGNETFRQTEKMLKIK